MAAQHKALTDDQDKRDKLKAEIDKLKGDFKILPKLIKGLQDRPARLLEALAWIQPPPMNWPVIWRNIWLRWVGRLLRPLKRTWNCLLAAGRGNLR